MQYWQFAATYGSGDYGACAYNEGGQQESCVTGAPPTEGTGTIGAPTTGEGGVVPVGPPGVDYWVIVGLTLIAIAGFIVALTRVFRRMAARRRQRESAKAE